MGIERQGLSDCDGDPTLRDEFGEIRIDQLGGLLEIVGADDGAGRRRQFGRGAHIEIEIARLDHDDDRVQHDGEQQSAMTGV